MLEPKKAKEIVKFIYKKKKRTDPKRSNSLDISNNEYLITEGTFNGLVDKLQKKKRKEVILIEALSMIITCHIVSSISDPIKRTLEGEITFSPCRVATYSQINRLISSHST